MVPTDQTRDIGQRLVTVKSRAPGVVPVDALCVGEQLASLHVGATNSRSAVEPDILEVTEQRMYRRGPWAGRATYQVADPRHRGPATTPERYPVVARHVSVSTEAEPERTPKSGQLVESYTAMSRKVSTGSALSFWSSSPATRSPHRNVVDTGTRQGFELRHPEPTVGDPIEHDVSRGCTISPSGPCDEKGSPGSAHGSRFTVRSGSPCPVR